MTLFQFTKMLANEILISNFGEDESYKDMCISTSSKSMLAITDYIISFKDFSAFIQDAAYMLTAY